MRRGEGTGLYAPAAPNAYLTALPAGGDAGRLRAGAEGGARRDGQRAVRRPVALAGPGHGGVKEAPRQLGAGLPLAQRLQRKRWRERRRERQKRRRERRKRRQELLPLQLTRLRRQRCCPPAEGQTTAPVPARGGTEVLKWFTCSIRPNKSKKKFVIELEH